MDPGASFAEHVERRPLGQGWLLSPTAGYLACIGLTLLLAFVALRRAGSTFPIAALLLTVVLAMSIARPAAAVYILVPLAVVGDTVTSSWYPFTKNFSSRESILFVADQFSLSPLDLAVAALVAGWLVHLLAKRQFTLRRDYAFWPLVVFGASVGFGLFYGLSTGGDRTIALWEFRPFVYLPVLYVVITNVFDRAEQYERVIKLALVAVAVNGVLALLYYRSLPSTNRAELETLVDHPAVLGMNMLFIFVVTRRLLRTTGPAGVWPYVLLAVPVVWAYLLSQRRAGVVALIVAFAFLTFVLFRHRRRRFWTVVPAVALVGSMYVAAFWSNTGIIGFPAQAVKTVIAPSQATEEDESSDLYRVIEDYNLKFTIQSKPITGIGLGQPFYRPIALPDISFFPFWQYIPHNSILAVWVKFGIVGIVSLLFALGRAVWTGGRRLSDRSSPADTATTFVCTAFVVMFTVFAWVDIAWSTQVMVLLAVAMGQIGARPREVTEQRATTVCVTMAGSRPLMGAS